MATGAPTAGQRARSAGAFDIRVIIAALFAIYGLVLTIVGVGATTAEDIAKSAGININLWGGIGMLVFAAFLAAWTWLRPFVVPEHSEEGTAPGH
jgi:hypothetical protein